MRVLIFGITGMLGHVLWESLNKDIDVYGTVRIDKKNLIEQYPLFENRNENIIDGINILQKGFVDKAIQLAKPDVVINCIGLIKQLEQANDPLLCFSTNSLFPHILAEKCLQHNARLIHISTDCVFSGQKGNYSEQDVSDVTDSYGRSKYLGEVKENNCLTIRTSLIGKELKTKLSLVEWFLAQQGSVKGYRKAFFSGLTTHAFSVIIKEIILNHPKLNGVYHVASEPTSKYDLLVRLKEVYDKDIEIIPDDNFVIDRSLSANKFKKDTGIEISGWKDMIKTVGTLR